MHLPHTTHRKTQEEIDFVFCTQISDLGISETVYNKILYGNSMTLLRTEMWFHIESLKIGKLQRQITICLKNIFSKSYATSLIWLQY